MCFGRQLRKREAIQGVNKGRKARWFWKININILWNNATHSKWTQTCYDDEKPNTKQGNNEKIKAVKYCSYKQVGTKQKLQPDLYHDHNNATKSNIWAQT